MHAHGDHLSILLMNRSCFTIISYPSLSLQKALYKTIWHWEEIYPNSDCNFLPFCAMFIVLWKCKEYVSVAFICNEHIIIICHLIFSLIFFYLNRLASGISSKCSLLLLIKEPVYLVCPFIRNDLIKFCRVCMCLSFRI